MRARLRCIRLRWHLGYQTFWRYEGDEVGGVQCGGVVWRGVMLLRGVALEVIAMPHCDHDHDVNVQEYVTDVADIESRILEEGALPLSCLLQHMQAVSAASSFDFPFPP